MAIPDELLFYNPDGKEITLKDRIEAENMLRLLAATRSDTPKATTTKGTE